MTARPEPQFGIVQLGPFAGFVQRFEDLIGSATTMALYFIHSRRWRENHDAAIKAFLGRPRTTDGFLGKFLAADMDDLRKECRKRAPQDLEVVIANAAP